MNEITKIPHKFQAEIKMIERKLKDAGHSLVNPEEMISGWKHNLKFFEEEYIGIFDEFINDLAPREILEEFIKYSSQELKEFIQNEVKPLDDNFISHTEFSQRFADYATKHGYPVWLYRRPKKIKANFVDDFDRI